MTLRIATAPTTGPSVEPVTVAECKLDSRIDGTEFDELLPALILAAREMCEQEAGRKLITQTWRVTAEAWPMREDTFVLSPLQSAEVSYWSGTAWTTLASDQWAIVEEGGAYALLPAYGLSFPSLGDLVGPRVRIDVVCGYGGAEAVPASLKMWIRAHVAAMLRSPDGMGDTSNQKMIPLHYLASLISPHKVYG